MVDRGNADKHRYKYSSGVKAQETSKWGQQTARSRYGGLDYDNASPPKPKDATAPQKLGDSGNLRAPDYDPNPSVNSWLRGGGKGGESYPGYVPGYRGKK